MKKVIMLFGLAIIMAVASGCYSTSFITEFDKDGNIVKTTETNQNMVSAFVDATKDKTVIAFSKGWKIGMEGRTASIENPTPGFELTAGNFTTSYSSFLKEQQNIKDIASIIQAIQGNLSITQDGIKSNVIVNKEQIE